MERLRFMKKRNKLKVCAIIFATIIISVEFIPLFQFSSGATVINDFYCDAQYTGLINGHFKYKADVDELITFTFDISGALEAYAVMGDGTLKINLTGTGSPFSHSYALEGFYNVTLNAWSGTNDNDTDWLIVEIINDAPDFDIATTRAGFYNGTYTFENDIIGRKPEDWVDYNNVSEFYMHNNTGDDVWLSNCYTVSGGHEDLRVEDNTSWVIDWFINPNHDHEIRFDITSGNGIEKGFTPGSYQLYFSANDSVEIWDWYNYHGPLFVGQYCNGILVDITMRNDTYQIARLFFSKTGSPHSMPSLAIDWFKLVRVDKGVQVVYDTMDHGKIVRMRMGNQSIFCGMKNNFLEQKYGTIEFWYKTGNINSGTTFILGDTFGLTQRDGKWYIGMTDITPQVNVVPITNEWFHIRFDFRDMNTISYQGLSLGFFRVSINGNASNEFPMGTGGLGITEFRIETNTTSYIDAVSYTWENYLIGNNLFTIVRYFTEQEIGFTLDNLTESVIDTAAFENYEKGLTNKCQYIWDFGDGNVSYEKVPIYKYINPGDYHVRLTLIDDQGAITTKVKQIRVIDREPSIAINWGKNYATTYDFGDDVNGRAPNSWFTYGDIKVREQKDGFSKVLEIDNTAGGLGLMSVTEPITDYDVGYKNSIEFWIYFTDVTTDEFYFWTEHRDPYQQVTEPWPNYTQSKTGFRFSGGKWDYYWWFSEFSYDFDPIANLYTPKNNEWVHIRLELNGQNQKWRLHVNDNTSNYFNMLKIDYSGNEINRIVIYTEAYSHIFLDSFGLTSDPNYELGDNNPKEPLKYHGTWDFRHIPDGEILFDIQLQLTALGPWIFTSNNFGTLADGCTASILAELDGHYKVLELQDNNPADLIQASLLDFSNPTYGTIEFWLRTNDISQGFVIAFGYEVFDSGIWLGNNGTWWYMNGQNKVSISDVPSMQDDTWHHIRIDFDCRTSGGYLELEGDQFYFWVDGTISNSGQPFNFDHDVLNFKWNIWSSIEEGLNYSIFLDAVGYTWDPAYEIGDNFNALPCLYPGTEILLFAQHPESSTYTDRIRCLWDFGDNQTAIGQTVFHTYQMPGKYNIKLTAIDSNGDYTYAEEQIIIENSYPELSIDKQYYGGKTSYDFDQDQLGSCPADWSVTGTSFGPFWPYYFDELGQAKVISGKSGLFNVVEMESLFGNTFSHDFQTPYLTNGTYEMWIYVNDVYLTSFGMLLDGEVSMPDYNLSEYVGQFGLNLLNTDISEATSEIWAESIHDYYEWTEVIVFEDNWTLQPNKWTHLRVDFCTDNITYMGLEEDTYRIYLDGHESQALPLIATTGDPLDDIDILSVSALRIFSAWEGLDYGLWAYNDISGGNLYLDNIGFSWDPNYTVGDNRYSNKYGQFNEGETFILECDSSDNILDYTQLIYNWGPPSTNVAELKDLGWQYSRNFIDDDDDDGIEGESLISFTADPYYAWDIVSYPIEVNNVLPSLNIHSPSIRANLSIALFNSGVEGANFSMTLQSQIYNQTVDLLYPSNFTDNWLNYTLMSLELDILNDWNIVINQTSREGGQHLFVLKFSFENGVQFTQFFNFDGIEQNWSINLNELWINSSKSLSHVPISFTASICDPSNDQINLDINYTIESVYTVDYSGAPFTKYYTSIDTTDDVFCKLSVYEASGNKYAKVQFIEKIDNDWDEKLRSGNFPVSYNLNFNADMTDINIDQFINDIFSSNHITPLTPSFQRNHFINASYVEFNPSCQTQTITFAYNISTDFVFSNVPPSISISAPFNITEDQTYTYLAEIEDLNGDNITVEFYFGPNDGTIGQIKYDGIFLGNNTYGVNYTYTSGGSYLITVIAKDGKTLSKSIHQIKVVNQLPYATISINPEITSEGQPISFEAEISDTESDINSTRYYWDFGDGCYSTEMSTVHVYINSGGYLVKFYVKDDNGGKYVAEQNITIFDAPPEILGPFSYIAIEGQSFLFDVDVIEGPKDFLMNYTWDIYKANLIYDSDYNFMNVSDGAIPGAPFGGFVAADGISYQVINNLTGHVKVLELVDNNNATHGEWQLTYGDSQSINGTIEFWLRTSYLSQNMTNFYINLFESGVGVIPIIIRDNGTWMYSNLYNGSSYEIPNLPIFTSKQWHHIRIDYECSNGSYSGLGENQWRIIVDGVSSTELDFQLGMSPFDDATFLDTLQISSSNLTQISIYCDAIGYYNGTSQYQLDSNVNPTLISQDYVETVYGLRPSVVFDEGTYFINLTVENELTSYAEFSLDVVNVVPVVSTSNKIYYGTAGYINMTAYAWDSFLDTDALEFEWYVEGERTLIESGTQSSTISVFCGTSGIIKGHVIVRDDGDLSSSTEFYIRKFMDNNGDGLTNEFEYLNNFTTTDQDGDNLPNAYEISIFGTDELDPDSDDDGLLDGWDNSTQIGEWFIGTDPLNNDTDYDGLIDGIEVYGWNVTVEVDEVLTTYYYSSDPLQYDTDNDGILDSVEYNYGTNPRDPDTDNDNLNDYIEIFVYGTDALYRDIDEDGLWDGIEVNIGTHFNKTDTDGDGLGDSVEYYGYYGYKPNPLCKDTDHDFLLDSAETFPMHTAIDGRRSVDRPVGITFYTDIKVAIEASITFLMTYGETASNESISDVKVQIARLDSNLILFSKEYELNMTTRYLSERIDIKEIIEGNQKSYYGTYVLTVTYLNSPHADLCLEEYSLDLTRILNPMKNDYDKDGILDGVETQLLVSGSEILEYDDLMNITADTNPNTTAMYRLEISDIGFMSDAEINFAIKSNETLVGNGSVYVEVIKRQLHIRRLDSVIYSKNYSFSTNDNFSQDYYLDLSGYFPSNYYGKYDILMDIYATNTTDVFTLTNVTIMTTGYRAADSSDTEAWITRPDKRDTDDDGWSDKYEIYDRSEPTNPLARDTDGDGTKDSIDRDPLHDLLLEIEFEEAQIYDLPGWYVTRRSQPYLQMTFSYKEGSETVAIVSPHTQCTQDRKTFKHWLFGIEGGVETRPRTRYDSTAIFNDKYFINIDDNKNKYLGCFFQTWDEGIGRIDQYWDTPLIKKSITYKSKDHAIDVPYTITRSSDGCYLEAKMTLRALSRVNTIAIYENGTVFNGHYNDQDRMHVYQINLNGLGLGSSFQQGENFIVIPNSVFIKTELNSIIQNDTKLANSIIKDGEFISMDRDNIPEKSSSVIESYFSITCSLGVALQILDLMLTGIINETTNETGIINQNASTKLDGFKAELMNLHSDILIIILIKNPYASASSGVGSLPREAGEWWADLFTAIGNFLRDVVNTIVNAIVNFVKVIVDFFVALVSLLIKGIILVLVYLTFLITLMITAGSFLMSIAMVALFCGARGMNYEVSLTSFTMYGDKTFSHGYYVSTTYNDFLGLDIPCIVTYLDLNGSRTESELHFFSSTIPMPSLGFYNLLNETTASLPPGDETDFYQGAADIMTTYGTLNSLTGAIIALSSKSSPLEKMIGYAGILLAAGGLITVLFSIINKQVVEGQITQQYIYGILIGAIIYELSNLLLIQLLDKDFSKVTAGSKARKYTSYIETVIGVGAILSGLYWIDDLTLEQIFSGSSIATGFYSIGMGMVAMILCKDPQSAKDFAYIYGKSAVVLSMILFVIACLFF